MGKNQSKQQVFDPNQERSAMQSQNEQITSIGSLLRQKAPKDGLISKEKFNEMLYVLEEHGLPQLRDTPTGYRLFFILASKSPGEYVTVDEMVSFGTQIFSNREEEQYKISFQILDRNCDNIVVQEEFINFVIECWQAAFRNLALLLSNYNALPQNMPPSLIGDWAKSQTQTVSQKAFQEFRKYDSGSGRWDYNCFKNWAKNSDSGSIVAKIGDYSVSVPLNLAMNRTTSTDFGFTNIR